MVVAFRILTEEELSLLDEKKYSQYMNELDVYQQRVAFVEKLAEIENAEIKPYSPKLKPIKAVKVKETKPYEKPEYDVASLHIVDKPEVKQELCDISIGKADISSFAQTGEKARGKAKIGLNEKCRFLAGTRELCSRKKCNIVNNQSIASFEKTLKQFEKTDIKISQKTTVKPIPDSRFKGIDRQQVVVPKTYIAQPNIGDFTKPKLPVLCLITDVAPSVKINNYENPHIELRETPRVCGASVNIKPIKKLEVKASLSGTDKGAFSRITDTKRLRTARHKLALQKDISVSFDNFKAPKAPECKFSKQSDRRLGSGTVRTIATGIGLKNTKSGSDKFKTPKAPERKFSKQSDRRLDLDTVGAIATGAVVTNKFRSLNKGNVNVASKASLTGLKVSTERAAINAPKMKFEMQQSSRPQVEPEFKGIVPLRNADTFNVKVQTTEVPKVAVRGHSVDESRVQEVLSVII